MPQALRSLAEQVITGSLSERLIDLLQLIEADYEQADRAPLEARLDDRRT